MTWLIKLAQGTGDPVADAVESLTDPATPAGGTKDLPQQFGVRIGVWSIINYLAMGPYNKNGIGLAIKIQLTTNPAASQAVVAAGTALADLGLQQLNLGDASTNDALKVAGLDTNTIRPSDLQNLFENPALLAAYSPAAVQREGPIAMGFLPEGQGTTTDAQNWWKNFKTRFQVLFDQAMKNVVQAPAPPVVPLAAGSDKWVRTALAAPPPPMPVGQMAPPMQGQDMGQGPAHDGPLLAEQYQSPDELKADLQKLIQAQADPEKYKQMWAAILEQFEDPEASSPETSDKEAAKEALTNYLEGGVGAFDFLWDLLVKNGRATALDNKIVGDVVQNNPELQKNDQAQAQAQAPVQAASDAKVAYAGLFLPPPDSGLKTTEGPMQKTAGGGIGGAGTGYGAYMMYGPEEKRMCPKLKNLVSTFICRYHCLDGLVIDDHQVLCGEAIWRGAMMDKFSVEYQDKNGNWTGGYINKRFEVDYNDGGHPALLKPGQRHAPIHEDAWSLEKRLAEMRNDEGSARGYSDTPGDGPKDLYNFDQHDIVKGPKPANLSEKPRDAIAGSNVQLKVASSHFEARTAGHDPDLEKQDPREVSKDDPSKEDLEGAEVRPPKQKKEPWPPPEEEQPWAKKASSEKWAKYDKTVSEDKFVRCKEHVKEESPDVNEYAVCTKSLGGQPADYHAKKDKKKKKDKKAFNLREIKANRGDPLMQPPPTNMAGPATIPGGVGEVGKVCAACGARQPKGTVMGAVCPYCKNPVKPLNHADAAQAAGAIEKVDSLAVTYFAGVYKAASADGRVAYASEVKEAVDKLRGVPKDDTVQDKNAVLTNNMKENMAAPAQGQPPPVPAPAPAQGQMGIDPTPSTKGRPMVGPQVPQEVGPTAKGTPVVPQAMAGSGRQDGSHIDGRSLDEFLSNMAGSGRHDEEHKEMMESMGLGPDTVRRPQ